MLKEQKLKLWNCPKENKKVTLNKCATCEYCSCFTDLSSGTHRNCIYDQYLIKDTSLIDGFAESDVMF